MIQLTDEEYGALMNAVCSIANGRVKTPNKHPRLGRQGMIEIARRACLTCHLDWHDYETEITHA